MSTIRSALNKPLVLIFLLGMASAVPHGAAGQAAITGLVVDARTSQPLPTVQVFVSDLDVGALTQANGQYLLSDVPVGTHTLTVQRLGYRSLSQQVTVTADETVAMDFGLTREALALEEILVTGTAGQARRREIGNSIAQVNLGELVESEVITGVEDLLTARVPGLTVMQSNSGPAAAGQIRLRGITSTSMGNQPLVYVDGVRVNATGYPRNSNGLGTRQSPRTANTILGSLDDINPADIERIEIIKGPAATTLYGTEAATGVIQIFTKRGVPGGAVWTAEIQGGLSSSRKFAPEPEPYYHLDRALRTGYMQNYTVSVTGGTAETSYFLSGEVGSNEGVLPNDLLEKVSVRGNFRFVPRSDLILDFNTGYTRRQLELTPQGHTGQGIGGNTTRCPGGCPLGDNWERDLLKLLDWEISDDQTHLITGVTASFNPFPSFSTRATVGIDYMHTDQRNIRPFGFILAPDGDLANSQWLSRSATVDYVANYIWEPSNNLRSTWSLGGQYNENETLHTRASSVGLAGPGEPSVSSGAVLSGMELRQRVVTGGIFGQLLLGYVERYFLTLGLRMDGNSAFGKDLGLEAYPKVSASYVISEEDWWSPALGQVKLRAAFGEAGRAPGAFDAVRTWDPVGLLGSPGFATSNIGNPDLGPERSAEIEVGFDAGFWDDRLTTEFTYYRRVTSDALFSVVQIPSNGWSGSQLENVGKIRNSGIELGAWADLLRNDRLTWTLGVTLATNESEVLDLGGAPEFSTGSLTRVVEGLPAPTVFGSRLLNPDEVAEPEFERGFAFGPNYPTRIVNLSTVLRFPGGISLSARADYQAGAYMWNRGVHVSVSRGGAFFCEDKGNPPYGGAYTIVEAGRADELTALVRSRCDTSEIPRDSEIHASDFFKLRAVTLQVPLPLESIGWNADNATLSVTLGNFFTRLHGDFFAFDPEIGNRQGPDDVARATTGDVPIPRTLTAALRVVF